MLNTNETYTGYDVTHIFLELNVMWSVSCQDYLFSPAPGIVRYPILQVSDRGVL